MSINDMIEQGIVFQGCIEVMQYDPEKDERFAAFDGIEEYGWHSPIEEPWADLPVGYIYSPYGCYGMVIEVG